MGLEFFRRKDAKNWRRIATSDGLLSIPGPFSGVVAIFRRVAGVDEEGLAHYLRNGPAR
jgi:hypothetical protein